jgi:hypothetical protein
MGDSMSTIVLSGDTSGTITLDAPAVAGTNTLMLPAVTGTLLTTRTAGSALQTISTAKSDTYSASVATNAETSDVTGLTVAITPSTNTNRILVTASLNLGIITGQLVGFRFYCNNTLIAVGDASGSRKQVTGSTLTFSSDYSVLTTGLTFYHSPASTSAQTYSIRLVHTSGATQTIYLNRAAIDDNANYTLRGISTITAMEIAA